MKISFTTLDITSVLQNIMNFSLANNNKKHIHKMLDKFFELTRDKDATLNDLFEFLIPNPTLIELCTFKKYAGKTFKEAVEHCLRSGDNYFDWLLGKLKEDPKKNQDAIYTINHWFKEFGYNPELAFKNKAEASNFFKKPS